MKSIQSVVAAATGFNATRGDQLNVETLPFESILAAEPPASMMPAAPAKTPEKPNKFSPVILGSIGGGVVLLLLGGFVYFRSRKKTQTQLAEMEAQLETARNVSTSEADAEISGNEEGMHEIEESGAVPELQSAKPFQLAPVMTSKAEVLTKFIAGEAEKDPAALAKIIRSWLNEPIR